MIRNIILFVLMAVTGHLAYAALDHLTLREAIACGICVIVFFNLIITYMFFDKLKTHHEIVIFKIKQLEDKLK